jgi:hypothetical protein
LPDGVSMQDAARGLDAGRCVVCGTIIEHKKSQGGRTDCVTEYGITVSNPFKTF